MLPDHPLVLHGGCNCGAIRYRIQVPARAERPLNPSSDGQVSFPMIATDHCNDCRRATGSILPTWICVPSSMLSCQLQPISSATTTTNNKNNNDPSETAPNTSNPSPWTPAIELFTPGPNKDNYHLKFYHSSPPITRTFCGRCGTNLTYFLSRGLPDEIFDVVLGTLDREDLEREWMAPDRHCWWDCGIKWVQELSNGGRVLPAHPRSRVDEFVE